MSGICGIVDFKRILPAEQRREAVQRMTDAIRHRGGKVITYSPTGEAELGMVASLLQSGEGRNCSGGPVNDGRLLLVDGAIFDLLSAGDADAGPRSVKEEKRRLFVQGLIDDAERIREVDGEFAFCLWDSGSRRMLLARDMYGSRPLFYVHQNDLLLFSSEIKSLLAAGLFPKELNTAGISDFLTYGYVPHPETMFKNLYHVEPGHYLLVSEDGISSRRYWSFTFGRVQETASEESLVGRMQELLSRAVAKRINCAPSVGAFLSGGLDSSSVCATMSRLTGKPVKAFSIGFKEQAYNELPEAELVAKSFNLDWTYRLVTPEDYESVFERLVWLYDSPFYDTSAIPSYFLAELAGKEVGLVLTGDGPDQIIAGSSHHVAIQNRALQKSLADSILQRLPVQQIFKLFKVGISRENLSAKIKRYLYRHSLNAEERMLQISVIPLLVKRHLFCSDFLQVYDASPPWRNILPTLATRGSLRPLEQSLLFDINFYMHDDLIPKVEKTCTANALECLSPYRDKDLAAFFEGLPLDYRMRGLESKYILKKAFETVLPREVVYKKKQGFAIPNYDWYVHELKGYVQQILFDKRTLARGYFNEKRLTRLLSDFFSGRTSYYTCSHEVITSLLTLELWHRLYIDQ